MIYLASTSPRRRELLAQIGINYELLLPESSEEAVDETPLPDEIPLDYVLRIARNKALFSWQRLVSSQKTLFPILAADTTVTIDHLILGKPTDAEEARHYLTLLSGQQHQVLTAVVGCFKETIIERLSINQVWFKPLTAQDIEWYIASQEYQDKAGGYALQGRAASFIKRIEGSPSGIVGLPLYETSELLKLITQPNIKYE
ncbi:MAG: septum formation inhibitor Maf [Ferrovum sp. 37-45-19]|jgi:septum formation protein|uniref:Maf family protein n=1 Tax=Ferrovum sp. JA12 TaxID=1356299 RepID=UPI0007038C78|nr:Maf family protein [Ferrovum sp. JA12]OYV80504.1 MAG: septum formation inhibitor Maf [Ferrovum sp. 21-44-67]OYV94819.1 MAG: septum formation inhibitor Maf [Ferrovum sp. 37-45-19]OZB34148.1 MAG: septum formation inhibitor Maf [Ferrovum sp. 34-44-207]HQT81054.1 Maf family protein [Ferrovaceae bacterium]KRH79221.1 Maf-like protein YhdE [Ferrovum sp. JA12]